MKEQKIIDLINASQAVIKSELLPQINQNKYELLMLLKSFEILRAYILNKEGFSQHSTGILQDYFHFPIKDAQEALVQLCSDLRENVQIDNVLELLEAMNTEEMKLVESKAAYHG